MKNKPIDETLDSEATGEELEKEIFRILADESPLGISLIGKDGRYKYINHQFNNIFGYTLDDIPTERIWFEKAFPDPEYRQRVFSTWKDDFKNSKAGQSRPRTFKVVCKDRSEKVINFRPVTLTNGAQFVIYEDITEIKQAEKELKDSEERFRMLFEYAPDAYYLNDLKGFFIDGNKAAEEMIGYNREELIGKNCLKLKILSAKQMPKAAKELAKIALGLPSGPDEYNLIRKDGSQVVVEIRTFPVKIKDQSLVLGIARNITKRKRAEEERTKLEAQLRHSQKMEAVGILAGGIAHDFNNLLQAIAGFTQVLMEEKDPSDPDYKRLQIIDQSAKEADDLINQLLIFSRKVESELRPVALNRKVEQVSKLLERTIPKMIDMEFHLAEDLKIINADPTQIEQILMNLGVNAKDAMPDGGKLIFETENVILDKQYCQTHPGAGPGEYVLLSVSDTGCGMDQDTLEHIFEPFYTTKETGKGTGLGLAMVYGIVKNHGGYITCYSEPGQGTSFKNYFPVLMVDITEQKTERKKEILPRGQETILLVDDAAAVLEVGKMMLGHYGYTTITSESGEGAIEIFEREKDHIDLVILDVGMPGMGGHKCLRRLLKIDPKVKVIIASGYEAGKVKETLESGAAGFIRKPYRLADISKKVREVLDKK